MARKKRGEPSEEPEGPVEGTLTPDEVAAAQSIRAEETPPSARPVLTGILERDTPEDTPAEEPPPKRRGRPPGSKNKPKDSAQSSDSEDTEAVLTAEDFLDMVDVANDMFAMRGVPPIEKDDARRWARKAAKVAKRWDASIPLFPELSLLVATAALFGPRVVIAVDPDYQRQWQAQQREAAKSEAERAAKYPPPA